MKKLHNNVWAGALFAFALLLSSCERNAEPDLQQLGWEYFPVKLGQYYLYDVYRIDYNFASENDTSTYEVKEVVADYYLNQQNDSVYIFRRYRRSTPEAQWLLDSAYQVQRTPQWIIQTANNRPVLKIAFPVGEGRTWNANLFNTATPDEYAIAEVGQPFETDFSLYPTTLQVIQEEVEDKIVETNQRKEVYASGIGLVYKRTNIIKYCSTNSCLGQEIINSGQLLEIQLKETGTE